MNEKQSDRDQEKLQSAAQALVQLRERSVSDSDNWEYQYTLYKNWRHYLVPIFCQIKFCLADWNISFIDLLKSVGQQFEMKADGLL